MKGSSMIMEPRCQESSKEGAAGPEMGSGVEMNGHKGAASREGGTGFVHLARRRCRIPGMG